MKRDLTKVENGLSEFLYENSDRFTDDWIEWLRERINTDTIHSLPDLALRNHIPQVIRSLSKYVRTPLELIRSEIIGNLSLHGRIRWGQGYQVDELLSEFEGLAGMISSEALEYLSTLSCEYDFNKTIVFDRLSTGLRSIGYITTSIYQEADSDHEKLLANLLQEFANNIAHEMNSPLQAINLGSSLLLEEETPLSTEKRKEHIKIIHQAVSHTRELLGNLHVLAMIEGSKATGRLVELKETINLIVTNLKQFSSEKNINISIVDPIPEEVAISSLPLHIILANLLTNAIKYHDRDKSKCWCRISANLITAKDKSTHCEITVEDNGVGIPDDVYGFIFTRRTRAHPHLAGGTGLGLSICKSIISEYGGEIILESKNTVGTTVKFNLPVVRLLTLSTEGVSSVDIGKIAVENTYNEDRDL